VTGVIAPQPPDPPLRDEAIGLRPLGEGDVPALVEALQDPEIPRWTDVPSPYRTGDALRWVGMTAAERGELSLGIRDRGDGRLLGVVGLRVDEPHSIGELGYWVAAPERGRGVVTRALRLVSGWALEELGLGRLQILVHPENGASRRAAERAGFRAEGRLRAYRVLKGRRVDLVMHSLLPGELP
jgi:RimJ/RimL family protein N-acetyltransferase